MQTIKICRGFQVPLRWDLNLSHDSASDSGSGSGSRSDSDCDCDCDSDANSDCCVFVCGHCGAHLCHTKGGGGYVEEEWRGEGVLAYSEYSANVCAVCRFVCLSHLFTFRGVCMWRGQGLSMLVYWQCLLNKFIHMFYTLPHPSTQLTLFKDIEDSLFSLLL